MVVYCLLVYGLLVHRCVDTLPVAIMSPQFFAHQTQFCKRRLILQALLHFADTTAFTDAAAVADAASSADFAL